MGGDVTAKQEGQKRFLSVQRSSGPLDATNGFMKSSNNTSMMPPD